MSITAERKQELIGEFQSGNGDTGSPEVQVAILTERIANLTEHMKTHKKDFPAVFRAPGSNARATATENASGSGRRQGAGDPTGRGSRLARASGPTYVCRKSRK